MSIDIGLLTATTARPCKCYLWLSTYPCSQCQFWGWDIAMLTTDGRGSPEYAQALHFNPIPHLELAEGTQFPNSRSSRGILVQPSSSHQEHACLWWLAAGTILALKIAGVQRKGWNQCLLTHADGKFWRAMSLLVSFLCTPPGLLKPTQTLSIQMCWVCVSCTDQLVLYPLHGVQMYEEGHHSQPSWVLCWRASRGKQLFRLCMFLMQSMWFPDCMHCWIVQGLGILYSVIDGIPWLQWIK
jgi:hypothetical protein